MHLLLLAIAPATIIILYIYFKDKFEKEPIPFLFKNFLLGATASVLITVILGGFADRLLPVTNVTKYISTICKGFYSSCLGRRVF